MSIPQTVIITRPVTRTISLSTGARGPKGDPAPAYQYSEWLADGITTPAGGPFPIVAGDGAPSTWEVKTWDNAAIIASTTDNVVSPSSVTTWTLSNGVAGTITESSVSLRDGAFVGELRNDFNTDDWYTWDGSEWDAFQTSLTDYSTITALTGYPGESTGGNGAADSGKLAKFGTLGGLAASSSVDVINSAAGDTFRAIFSTIGLGVAQTSGTNSGASSFLFFPSLTNHDDEFQWSLPAKSGTVAMTSDIHAPATVSGNGIAIAGQQISLSIGTGATQVAAGNHPHTAAEVGAVSSAIPDRVTRIMTFGDSITGYYQAASAPFNAFYFGGYQAYLQQLSQGRFEYIPNAAGRAVWSYSGKSAAELLADGSVTLAAASLTGSTDGVIVLLGANDVGQRYSAARSAANIIAVWDQFRATGAQVVGAEVIPFSDNSNRDVVLAINRILAAAAVERQMRFIPWYSVLDNFSEDFNVGDTVHPSVIGQSKMGHRAFEVVAGMLAPYAARTGFLSSNPTCAGATAGGGWIPTGFAYSATATIEAAPLTGYVTVPGETSWLNLRLTGASTNKAITINTPALTTFSANEYKFSAEFDVIVVSGRPRFTEYTLYLRENTLGQQNLADQISSTDRTFFDAATYVIPQGPRLIETPWIPKNYSATWTSLTGYLRLALLADSVVDLRFRNVGIIGR